MTDWKQIARALDINASDAELNKTLEPLARLEQEFRRIASRLAPDSEPAVTVTSLIEDSAE
jgi:hypothetical protein